MKKNLCFFYFFLLLAFLVSSCQKTNPVEPGNGQASTIHGIVLRSDDLSRVPNALVTDIKSSKPADTTDSNGAFAFTYQLDKSYSGTLVAILTGFTNDTLSFSLQPGANDTLSQALVLKADSTSPKTAATSGRVASIVLISGGDASSLAIRGTGFQESTPLTFQARDSVGVPVFGIHRATIYFSLLGGPGGGEYVFPTSAVTDLSGSVVTRVASGTRPGVVQIYAYAKPDSANPAYIVSSAPVRLTISGGLPDAAHFSMNVAKVNIAGISQDNLKDAISVIVGDRFGNPVQQGTAIYFSTTAGIIQPSAKTDVDGNASVSLISANPRPSGTGLVFVTARTVGDSGAVVARTDTVLFSGPPRIIVLPGATHIADSSAADYYYMVSDSNGNPLSSGATIAVTKDGPGAADLVLSGDVNKTMGDTKDRSQTNFNFHVQDGTRGGASGTVTFTITVTGDNGAASYSWDVIQDPGGFTPGGGSTGMAASVQLVGTSTNSISVRGTGQLETAILSYIVRDSVGNPITAANAVDVTFTIQNGPGGGEYVFPANAMTDAFGKASTAVNAGTKPGVVQVVASALVNGVLSIRSAPVQLTIAGGLADINHSRMWSDAVNYPILVSAGKSLGTVSVQLGDLYNNPAQPSAVYFTTNGGLITRTAITGENGQASATLFGGGQYPAGGIDTITAVTQGNQNITQRLIVTASGAPIITAPTSLPNMSSGGFVDVDYDVKDLNGNPLAAGNNVSVTLSGAAGGQLVPSGDKNFTTVDTRDTASVHYRLRLSNAGGASGGNFTATISVLGPNGSASTSFSGYLVPQGVIGGGSGGGTGFTSSIKLVSSSATDISVQGTGNSETATLVFQGFDSLGTAVDQAHGSMMHFVLAAPSLGAVLTIDSIQMDPSGKGTTLVRSGTQSGVVQVRASVVVNGRTVFSDPVRLSINSGLPDQAHFTMGAPYYNFPGLDYNFLTLPITIQMGDIYSNPVPAGTAVYFSSTHGVIQTQAALSDANGFVTKTLYSANPRPDGSDTLAQGPGWTKVYAKTFDQAGNVVSDSLFVLWTGAPIIVKTSGPATYNLAPGGSAGPWTFTVTDRLGHPLSRGTNISVGGTGVQVNGQASVTLVDAFSGGSGVTDFTVSIQNANGGPTALSAPVTGILMVTVNHQTYGVYTFPLATGVAN